MIFKLTTKGFRISTQSYGYIGRHLDKVVQTLPHIQNDLIVFRLILKKNAGRYHPRRTHPHPYKDYSNRKTALSHYEGFFTFRLNKRQLYVHCKGMSVNECTDTGFGLIFRELKRFKDLHFSSESEYPDHSSIRGRI